MSKLATSIRKEKLIGTPRKRFEADRPFPKDFLAKTRKKYALKGPIKPKLTLDMTIDPDAISKKLAPFLDYQAAQLVEDSLDNFDLDERAREASKNRSYIHKESRWAYTFPDGSGLIVDDGQLDNRVFVFIP